jgi:hypothetical protein
MHQSRPFRRCALLRVRLRKRIALYGRVKQFMATPQVPAGRCPLCQSPIVDVFAEWTDEYQTTQGKRAIMAGDVVFDCYYCEAPLQLILPLALISPRKNPGQYKVAKRRKSRCEDWLRSQHPGVSLSQVIELANWQFGSKWAFDGYTWIEGLVHRHGQDQPLAP